MLRLNLQRKAKYAVSFFIQIQPMLRLNASGNQHLKNFLRDSNTTNVKVKLAIVFKKMQEVDNSNTTNVKVKPKQIIKPIVNRF